MKINFSDPKPARLPKKMHVKPFRQVPLVDPGTFIAANPRLSHNLERLNPIQPEQIRADLEQRLQQSVQTVNDHIQSTNIRKGLRFQVHEASGYFFAAVRNEETGEVLKTIPAQRMLDLAARLQDVSGLLADIKA